MHHGWACVHYATVIFEMICSKKNQILLAKVVQEDRDTLIEQSLTTQSEKLL